ncbi:MAG: iron ABC transporter permease [Actinomycetota bacterium]
MRLRQTSSTPAREASHVGPTRSDDGGETADRSTDDSDGTPLTPPSTASPGSRPGVLPGAAVPVVSIALALALPVAIVVATGIGAVGIPTDEVWEVVSTRLVGGSPDVAPEVEQIIWTIRLPRVLLAAIVGAGLALAGLCLQAVVRNPLADPYILGAASGASAAAVAVIVLGSSAVFGLGLSTAAFFGALGSLLLTLALGQRAGQVSSTRLILAGVAVGYVFSAVTSFLQLQAEPNQLRGVIFWLLGSFASAEWPDLVIPAAALVVVGGLLTVQGPKMNALVMGDDTAASLGIRVGRYRVWLLILASLVTGACISVAGGIGFVGLMIPHAARLAVGPDHRRLLPVAVLGGAVFLVFVDVVARRVAAPAELPIGIFTAAIGGPAFLAIMSRNNTWASGR